MWPLKNHFKFLILGAGPTGLGAAYRLKELNQNDFIIFESSDRPGGLAKSSKDNQGFYWDVGVHIIHSHYKYFDEALSKVIPESLWIHKSRLVFAHIDEVFVPYPVQYNIHFLPEKLQERCLEEFESLDSKNNRATNFLDWLRIQFGKTLCEIFLEPYNKKVWGYSPADLGVNWVGSRVPALDILRIKRNIKSGEVDTAWGSSAKFRVPKHGGNGATWEAFANHIGGENIQLNNEIVRVDLEKKRIVTKDNKEASFDFMLNTGPISRFSEISCAPTEIRELTKTLKKSSVYAVGLGLKGEPPKALQEKTWVYIADPNISAHRVTVLTNIEKSYAPSGHWSLMFEVCETENRKINKIDLVEKVINEAKQLKYIKNDEDVVSSWQHFEELAYPTPTIDRDEILSKAHLYFEKHHVSNRGRFGGWKYEVGNQDHSFMQGVEWANKCVLNESEKTYFYPEIVNKK